MGRWAAMAAAAAVVLAPALAGAETAAQVERDIAANREELARLREQATSVLDELNAIEQETRLLDQGAAKIEGQLKSAALRVAAAQREEDAARGELVAKLRAVAPRLQLRYALSRARRAELLLGAKNPARMQRRRRDIDALLASDLDVLRAARDAFDVLKARRATLEEAKAEQAARVREWDESRAKARARRQELAQLHSQVLDEQGLREKTLRELSRAQAELSQFVEDLGSEDQGTQFARRKGHLVFPTRGFIEVGYGKVLNARFNTVTFQKGIDIRAPQGSEVVAVAPGTVVHAAPFRGYGNLVIVDHGEGFHSLYAHLDGIERANGESVAAGEVVGHVGDSGSLKGAYLYFELRDRGQPVDPKAWLAPR